MNKFSLTFALSLCAIVALLICINFKEPSTAPKALVETQYVESVEMSELEVEITRAKYLPHGIGEIFVDLLDCEAIWKEDVFLEKQ